MGVSKLTAPHHLTRVLAGALLYREAGSGLPAVRVQNSDRILVLRLDSMGDLVLMSPFLRELRRSNQDAWITLVVDPRFVNLVELCPYANEVLTFNPRKNRVTGPAGVELRALRFAQAHLWKRKFDLALLPRWGADTVYAAFIAYFSCARCRVGYSESVSPLRRRLNPGYDEFLTQIVHDSAAKHEVEHNLELLRAAGGSVSNDELELWLNESDRGHARKALTSCGFREDQLLIGIVPSASHPKKRWPIERFIELGRFLAREYGARLVIIGGPEDAEMASHLQGKLGSAAISFAGEMTIRQTAALLEHMKLVVANDTGPMHLAAAASGAVLEISCHPGGGDFTNSPVKFHPWTKEYAVLQPSEPAEPCTGACEWHEAHCILGVSLEAAKSAARNLLARAGRRAP
jgi:lipopolysaccharide heptosyltransferase II